MLNVNFPIESMLREKAQLCKGEYITLEENHVMNNKQLTLTCKVKEFSRDEGIRLGHGEREYNFSFIDVTNDKLLFNTSGAAVAEIAHGLTVSDFVSISISVGFTNARVTIASASGTFETELHGWRGRMGNVFAKSLGGEIYDVKLRWSSGAYAEPIWLFGDSYFDTSWGGMWPYYLVKDGYRGFLLSGFPGRNSASALEDFKRALRHGVPKYAVWCLGMNDADKSDAISESYITPTREFISLCEERGIIPILSTVPCTPARKTEQGYEYENVYKNDFVRSSGYRYIDFAQAVGAALPDSPWYDGMLDADGVHPTPHGAYALYARALADFPEIMQKRVEGVSK